MTTNVLILCTHNSARSVLAEGMLNHWAKKLGKDVQAFSAGSAPSGRINPFALDSLARAGVSVEGFRSKSWDEFTGAKAPVMRVVITVCDSAAAETCPYWPGSPVRFIGATRTHRTSKARKRSAWLSIEPARPSKAGCSRCCNCLSTT